MVDGFRGIVGQNTTVANKDDSRTRNPTTYSMSSVVCKN